MAGSHVALGGGAVQYSSVETMDPNPRKGDAGAVRGRGAPPRRDEAPRECVATRSSPVRAQRRKMPRVSCFGGTAPPGERPVAAEMACGKGMIRRMADR